VPVHSSPRIFRFSTFELNLHTGELRQRGLKVKLQEQLRHRADLETGIQRGCFRDEDLHMCEVCRLEAALRHRYFVDDLRVMSTYKNTRLVDSVPLISVFGVWSSSQIFPKLISGFYCLPLAR
jgi:hypothetical protein